MSDLTAFLLARIAEDTKRAEEVRAHEEKMAEYREPGEWSPRFSVLVIGTYDDRVIGMDGKRALAECEAKRRIVGYRGAIGLPADGSVPNGEGMTYLDGAHAAVTAERERIMRLLALPYADHPDYRDEWKP